MIKEWDLRGNLEKAIENYKSLHKFSDPIAFKDTVVEVEGKEGLRVEFTDIIDHDGQYIDDRKTILINKNISYPQRQNFTFFHEFTHYLIYRVDEFQDIFEFINEKITDKNTLTKTIEWLCNIGAADFLIDQNTQAAVKAADLSNLNTIKGLMEVNSTLSTPALAWKIADTRKVPMSVVIVHNGINQRKKENKVAYPYIEYSFNTDAFKYPCWGSLPKDHLLKRGVEEGFDLEGDEATFPFSSSTKMPCYIIGYRYTPDRYIAFLYQNRPVGIDPNQISLLPF